MTMSGRPVCSDQAAFAASLPPVELAPPTFLVSALSGSLRPRELASNLT